SNAAADANGTPTTQTFAANGRSASYQPVVGQRYYWEDGNDSTHYTTYTHSVDTFWGMDVIGTDNVDTTGWDVSNSFDTMAQPLPAGPWVSNQGANQYAGYTFSSYNVTTGTPVITDAHQDRSSHG